MKIAQSQLTMNSAREATYKRESVLRGKNRSFRGTLESRAEENRDSYTFSGGTTGQDLYDLWKNGPFAMMGGKASESPVKGEGKETGEETANAGAANTGTANAEAADADTTKSPETTDMDDILGIRRGRFGELRPARRTSLESILRATLNELLARLLGWKVRGYGEDSGEEGASSDAGVQTSATSASASFLGSFSRARAFVANVSAAGLSEGEGLVGMKQITFETETTSFEAKGRAVTEDGRVLDFGISVEMSRSFASVVKTGELAFRDPLMINVGSDVAKVSDQKFFFDLDSDGEAEEISGPGPGSGFLALDLNGDGRIGDGSELFGTKSGDGFADLAAYDEDGNGWIDENDSVFSKLKVWCKTAVGTDELLDLKKADVGAIFLGSAATEFSLRAATAALFGSAPATDAVIRRTGMYLKESGGIGTVQHVDLAVS